jgi:predicted RNA binding protein YcfA (HicA-like mRNA interferase family)
MPLNKKQIKTLQAVYAQPTRATIKWADIESLLKACGAVLLQRQGSRVCVKLGDQRAVFHTPHPQKEAVKGAVEDIRGFLQRAGIRP